MEWTTDPHVALLRDMYASDLLTFKKASPERGMIWDDIADRLNSIKTVKFRIREKRRISCKARIIVPIITQPNMEYMLTKCFTHHYWICSHTYQPCTKCSSCFTPRSGRMGPFSFTLVFLLAVNHLKYQGCEINSQLHKLQNHAEVMYHWTWTQFIRINTRTPSDCNNLWYFSGYLEK